MVHLPLSMPLRFEADAPAAHGQVKEQGDSAFQRMSSTSTPTAPSFDVEILTCPRCGGPRKVISVLSYGPVVRRFLECIRENADAPEAERARPPPGQIAFGW